MASQRHAVEIAVIIQLRSYLKQVNTVLKSLSAYEMCTSYVCVVFIWFCVDTFQLSGADLTPHAGPGCK